MPSRLPDLWLIALLEAKGILDHHEAEALVALYKVPVPVNLETAELFLDDTFGERVDDAVIASQLKRRQETSTEDLDDADEESEMLSDDEVEAAIVLWCGVRDALRHVLGQR